MNLSEILLLRTRGFVYMVGLRLSRVVADLGNIDIPEEEGTHESKKR